MPDKVKKSVKLGEIPILKYKKYWRPHSEKKKKQQKIQRGLKSRKYLTVSVCSISQIQVFPIYYSINQDHSYYTHRLTIIPYHNRQGILPLWCMTALV